MRLLIGLAALYALMFAAPRWGWIGAISVAGIAFVADLVWRNHQREMLEQRKASEAAARKNRESALLEKFFGAGCFLLGDAGHIWRFEDRYDLDQTLNLHELSDLKPNQFLMTKSKEGYLFAFNHAGWPPDLSEWNVRDVVAIVTDKDTPGHRSFVDFAKTPRAIEHEQENRRAHLDAVRLRVSERTRNLQSRTALDMGLGAAAVYVITTKGRNCAKIGISDNPQRRRANLQTGSPEQLAVHTSYWMENRTHAALVEQRCHRRLKSAGHFKIGEWFSVEPEIASRYVAETYAELVEQRAIIEGCSNASEQSTDEELRTEVISRTRWRNSKKGNFIADLFGRKVTVFSRRDGWHWVCDGQFSKSALDSPDAAQRSVIGFISPGRSQMLDYLLNGS